MEDEIARTVGCIDRVVDSGISDGMNSNNRRWINLRDFRAWLHIELLCNDNKCGEEHCANGPETNAMFACFMAFFFTAIKKDRLRAP